MNLSEPLQPLVQDKVAAETGPTMRCVMANFRWESAVSDDRAKEYANDVGAVAAHKEWQAEHKNYLSNAVHIAKDLPRCAESFMARNGLAQLDENLDDTYLLRLEGLDGLFNRPLTAQAANDFWHRFFRSQKDLRKPKLSDADEALRAEFTKQWNEHRTQARPLFATFLNAFGGNLEALTKQDWPHMLRDRLGLTHWPREADKPLPVALVCYTVEEVRQSRLLAGKKGADASFSRPTVLDVEFSPAFIPAPLRPGGESYGYTLDLTNAGRPDTGALTPELLTFPLEYKPEHVKALGFISRPHVFQEEQAYLPARNRHVQGLRALPDCTAYGEVLL
ncbi:MAG: hypothetical protein RBT86_03345 [Azospira sp.]|jgi:hypothetical protein|nr:hypothetical protein [Azospira sp.]